MNRAAVYGMAVGVGAVGVGVGLYLLGRRLFRRSKHSHGHGHDHGSFDDVVEMFVGFHYGLPEEYIPYPFGPKDALHFPKRCAELCLKYKAQGVLSRAMDLGCGPGGITFELARGFSEVVGLDISQPFIARCQELKMMGQTKYWMTTEGDLGETKTATVDPAIDRTKVQFILGDACNLPKLGQFGCVIAANLICTLPEPRKFFKQLPELIVPGGILVIIDHCSRNAALATPKEQQLGGFVKEGKEIRGFDTLQDILHPHFELVEEQDMPLINRETARAYYWMAVQATVWRRRQKT